MNNALRNLIVALSMRNFAIASLAVFIPIYLLNLGHTLKEVLLFFSVLNLAHAVLIVPVGFLSKKLAFGRLILLSAFPLALFYYFLNNFGGSFQKLLLVSVLFGASNALFWMSYHTIFSSLGEKGRMGKELGTARIFSALFYALGPLFGGLVLSSFGFLPLFFTASLILVASTIPVFLSDGLGKLQDFSPKGIFSNRSFFHAVAFSFYGLDLGVAETIWPIFVMGIVSDFSTLGSLTFLGLFFSILSYFIFGRLSDTKRKATLVIGTVANSIIWFLRVFVKTPLSIFGINLSYGVSQAALGIPIDAASYEEANKKNHFEYIAFREISINGGRGILFLLISLLPSSQAVFLITGFLSLSYLFFARDL